MPSAILLAIGLTDFIWIVVGLFILFTSLSIVVLSLTWLERKVLGRLQRRLGPTRTGPMGLMQPMADALKLILKEDIIPASSEKAIFWVAPIIVVVSAFMIWVTIPGTQNAVIQNLDLGLFYIIAFSVVGILGLVLASSTSSPSPSWASWVWFWRGGARPTNTAPLAVCGRRPSSSATRFPSSWWPSRSRCWPSPWT